MHFYVLEQDTLYFRNDKGQQKEIGFFMPTASPQERHLIKEVGKLYDVISEYLIKYDETKNVLKPVFECLKDLIDIHANYSFHWVKTTENELLNSEGNLIFIFSNHSSIYAREIAYSPELYQLAHSLLKSLSSINSRLNLKHHYQEINKMYGKVIDGE